MLTVPCIILVAMSGVGIARWIRPGVPFHKNSVVRGVCYAAGFQFMAIGLTCVAVLVYKIMSGSPSVLPDTSFGLAVFCGLLLLLLLLSSMSVFQVLQMDGTTRLSRSRPATAVLSGLAMTTVLLGVTIANSISFDLEATIAEVRVRQQQENLSDVKVAMRTLSSRMVQDELGRCAIEMSVGFVNVSDQSVVVPRPFALEHVYDPTLSPLQVMSCSADSADEAGWVMAPAATRPVRWMLDVPAWCAEPQYQRTGLPISLVCFPLHGTDDVFRTHPIGHASLIVGELAWPMSEALKSGNQQEVDRIAGMISQTRIR